MTGFLVFVGIVVAIVMLFRYWRRREMEAFLDTDLAALHEFRREAGVPDDPETQALAAKVVNMRVSEAAEPPAAPEFQSRQLLFDEVHRSCLQALESVIEGHYRIFVHVPLTDLFRADDKAGQVRLEGKTLSFVLCDRSSLAPVCGIHLKGAGQTEVDRQAFVENLFRQVDLPLVTLPMLTTWSALELKESLAHLLDESPLARHCPKCGREMMMRKAIKGRNAGKSFWVCKEFPSCRGIMRIGQF